MKKIILLLLIIVFVSGCAEEIIEEDIVSLELEETVILSITFNDDVKFTQEFKNSFIEEVENIQNNQTNLKMDVTKWFSTIPIANIKINLSSILSKKKKDNKINSIQEDLESLNSVSYTIIPPEESSMEEDNISEASEELLAWFYNYGQWFDFDHPYISCIFENSCNGTFFIGIEVSSEENTSEINETLSEYGYVQSIHCFTNVLNKCSIDFETNDIYLIDNFFNASFINDITLWRIESDYQFPISDDELYLCEKNSDCVSISSGCCGCNSGGTATSINKDYESDWNSYSNMQCMGMGCLAVMSDHWTCFASPKCIDNRCELVENPIREFFS